MKHKKSIVYQHPCLKMTNLDMENLICGSTRMAITVDELENLNIETDGSYFEDYIEF